VGPRAGLDRCEKSCPHRIRFPDRPARSQSLYRLNYVAQRSSSSSSSLNGGGRSGSHTGNSSYSRIRDFSEKC
jgi:hypothetical protein